jgi:NAD(P)H dehydrogenase (quinone)
LKTFIDSTSQLWQTEALNGKFATLFVSTGMSGGGQEVAAIAMMSTLAHHGIIYVSVGKKRAVKLMKNMDEVHGGSPWELGLLLARECRRSWS